MNRRDILKYTAMLTGTALCAPLTSAMLSGCSPQPVVATTGSSTPALHFFSQDDFQLLSQIMDVILPKTDSPSATDVGTNLMMDQMFGLVFKLDYQDKFNGLFAELRQYLAANKFSQLQSAQQVALLQALELEDKESHAYWAYIDIKQQTVSYYLSCEQIAENYLNYLPIPGEYKPCVSLAELGGKAWAI
jgi:hypothetical protein